MKNKRKEQLRRIIQEMVREELVRSGKADPSVKAEKRMASEGKEPDLDPAPKPHSETPSLPPWVVFGPPRPAPEKGGRKNLRNPHSSGPYKPEQPLDPPPFISGNDRQD